MDSLQSMAGGTLAILLTQSLVAITFIGLGLWIRRRFGLRDLTSRDIFVAFWVGFAGTNLFLMVWNFVLPIHGMAALLLAIAGGVGITESRQELLAMGQRARDTGTLKQLLLLGLAAVWVANLCRGPLWNSDTSLYHLQAMLWARDYPVVPGLANLFGPLGFNNVSLLYAALLEAGPWTGMAHHLASGVICQALLLGAISALLRLPRLAGAERVLAVSEGIILIPAINLVLRDWLTSFATDLPSLGMQFMMGAQAIRLFLLHGSGAKGREAGYELWTVALLGSTAVSFKLSSAALVAMVLLWCGVWWAVRIAAPAARRRTLLWTALTVGLIGGTWVARGVLLSGYPLFPMPVLGLPVEWRAPVEHAAAEYAFAAHSARASTENAAVVLGEVGIRGWVPEWWTTSASREPYSLILPLLLAGFLLVLRFARRAHAGPGRFPPDLLLLPVAAAIVLWFFAAPEPRYAMAMFWTAAAILAAGVCQAGAIDLGRSLGTVRAAITALGLSSVLVVPLIDPHPRIRKEPALSRVLWTALLLPGGDAWFYPTPAQEEGEALVTATGLHLTVAGSRCAALPPPCTPNPAPNVRLRTPGDIRSGFVVDGPWMMENWPNARRLVFGELWRRSHHAEQEGSSSPP